MVIRPLWLRATDAPIGRLKRKARPCVARGDSNEIAYSSPPGRARSAHAPHWPSSGGNTPPPLVCDDSDIQQRTLPAENIGECAVPRSGRRGDADRGGGWLLY